MPVSRFILSRLSLPRYASMLAGKRSSTVWHRLHEQRDAAVAALGAIPGVSCTVPRGAMYVFPRLDPGYYPIKDDQQFVLQLLREQHVLVVQGTGFNWPEPDHLRIVTLPRVDDLTEAIARLGQFLAQYEGDL